MRVVTAWCVVVGWVHPVPLVLVLSIAVLVLDRLLRRGLRWLDQPSQHRHHPSSSGFTTSVGFVIRRLSSTSTVALSTSTIDSVEGVRFVSKDFRVSDPRLRRWSAPWIGWVGTGTAATKATVISSQILTTGPRFRDELRQRSHDRQPRITTDSVAYHTFGGSEPTRVAPKCTGDAKSARLPRPFR